jgi:hypothetical protein
MRWDRAFRDEVREKIGQLGLARCLVCASEELEVYNYPAVLPVAGFAWEPPNRRDEESNVMFMVMIGCSACGHTMFFDSDRFRTGDEPTVQSRAASPPYSGAPWREPFRHG